MKRFIRIHTEQPTRRQAAIVHFIKAFTDENGYCPSFEEIGAMFNMKSKSRVEAEVDHLRNKGFLKSLPRRARSIEVLMIPLPVYRLGRVG
jgi:repressor LexA